MPLVVRKGLCRPVRMKITLKMEKRLRSHFSTGYLAIQEAQGIQAVREKVVLLLEHLIRVNVTNKKAEIRENFLKIIVYRLPERRLKGKLIIL